MNEDCFHLGIKALIRNTKGKILLLKTNPAQLRGYTGDPYWDIPGGRIHQGDTIEQTLKRELMEETGITEATDIKPLVMVLSPIRIPTDIGSVGLILSVYLCTIDSDPIIKLSDEHLEAGWFSPSDAARLLEFKYPREFTKKILTISQTSPHS